MSIKAEKLSHIYNEGTAMESYALKDISFEIESGSFIGLIGHTGSGKSTLVQHLNGLLKPTKGSILFKGEDIFAKGYDLKTLRGKIGLVFQYPEYQLFEEDILKDVMFGPKNMGYSEDEAKRRAEKALKSVGVDENMYERSPFELSGGQKRRTAIAGVLAMEPEVLILDEPTAGLDPKGRDEILSMIDKLHEERGMTVILVSHSMEDVAEYADKILVLANGEVKYFDTPKNVFKHAEELENYGLSAPAITYFMKRLKDEGFDVPTDITKIDEAKEAILKAFEMR